MTVERCHIKNGYVSMTRDEDWLERDPSAATPAASQYPPAGFYPTKKIAMPADGLKSYTLAAPHIGEAAPKLRRRCLGCLRHTTHYRYWYRRPPAGFHYST